MNAGLLQSYTEPMFWYSTVPGEDANVAAFPGRHIGPNGAEYVDVLWLGTNRVDRMRLSKLYKVKQVRPFGGLRDARKRFVPAVDYVRMAGMLVRGDDEQ